METLSLKKIFELLLKEMMTGKNKVFTLNSNICCCVPTYFCFRFYSYIFHKSHFQSIF